MKKPLIIIITLVCIVVFTYAQVPESFNYQAVVRNSSGELVADKSVSFRITILQNSETGTPVYVENHTITTNSFGLANLKIGQGTIESGVFDPGGWGLASHFLKVELDPAGGSSFVHLGTVQLLSVPYAFHAKTVEVDQTEDADADPGNEIQSLSISGTQLTLSDGGGTVELPSAGGGDNWGAQTVASDATLTGEGTTANPLSVNGDLTDNQTLSVTDHQLAISDGNTVALPDETEDADADPANEIQTLSVVGNDLSISDGNTVALPVGGSSPWLNDGDDIYFNTGKAGIGKKPGADLRKFQSWAGNEQAIAAENNSNYPTLFVRNNGSGIAAEFRNSLKIKDGTEGDGKVLTSDANGITSWQNPAGGSLWMLNGDEIYYDNFVGIGTNNPNFELDIVDETSATYTRIMSEANNAGLLIQRAESDDGAHVIFKTGGSNTFYAGLLESNSFKISTSNPTLNGLEVNYSGDVTLSDDLFLAEGQKIGIGDIDPDSDIDINSANPGISVKSTLNSLKSGNAYLILDKIHSSKLADIVFRSNGSNQFFTGLLGNNNYRISTSSSSLNGLEVQNNGNVKLSGELNSATTGTSNMMPFAYGYVTSAGSKNSGTSNFTSVTKAGTGRYTVNITNLGTGYIAIVTPNHGSAYLTGVVHARGTSSITVAIWDTKDDEYKDGGFSFVIYKP